MKTAVSTRPLLRDSLSRALFSGLSPLATPVARHGGRAPHAWPPPPPAWTISDPYFLLPRPGLAAARSEPIRWREFVSAVLCAVFECLCDLFAVGCQ
jgi:hypothetical protein